MNPENLRLQAIQEAALAPLAPAPAAVPVPIPICASCNQSGHHRMSHRDCPMNPERLRLQVIQEAANPLPGAAADAVNRARLGLVPVLLPIARRPFQEPLQDQPQAQPQVPQQVPQPTQSQNQQEFPPLNQQELDQLFEEGPAEDDMNPYDPIAPNVADPDAPSDSDAPLDPDAAADVPVPGQVPAEEGLDAECMLSLQTMLEEKNRFCAVYKNIREREIAQGGVVEHYKILLKAEREKKKAPRRRQYDIPSANEIAVLMPGDETAAEKETL
ncbi:unnamed protein product [Mortierella alpina]